MVRSVADWTIFVFGLMAMAAGLIGLTSPEMMLKLMRFPIRDRSVRDDGDLTITFLVSSSMASFNMGFYYLLAAWCQWRRFYQFTVIFRLVTVFVFIVSIYNGHAPGSFIGIALWELLGAFITGVALWYEGEGVKQKKQ